MPHRRAANQLKSGEGSHACQVFDRGTPVAIHPNWRVREAALPASAGSRSPGSHSHRSANAISAGHNARAQSAVMRTTSGNRPGK